VVYLSGNGKLHVLRLTINSESDQVEMVDETLQTNNDNNSHGGDVKYQVLDFEVKRSYLVVLGFGKGRGLISLFSINHQSLDKIGSSLLPSNLSSASSLIQQPSNETDFIEENSDVIPVCVSSSSTQSYDGKTSTLLLISISSDGCLTVREVRGDVNDYGISYKGSYLGVCWGRSPFQLSIFKLLDDGSEYELDPVIEMEFGRNVIIFHPIIDHLFAVGGFGNLSGGMDICGVYFKKKKWFVGYVFSDEWRCSTNLEWSCDGRWLKGHVTKPRMNIDNGCFLVLYDGTMSTYNHQLESLFSSHFIYSPSLISNNIEEEEKKENENENEESYEKPLLKFPKHRKSRIIGF